MPVPNVKAPIFSIIDKGGSATEVEVLWREQLGRRLLPATGTGFVSVVDGMAQPPTVLAEVYSLTIEGAPIGTGIAGFFSIPHAGTIVGVRVLSVDASVTSGDLVLDLWKDTFANYPPTNADSITGGNEPTITADVSVEDTTLTSWSTSVAAGDVVAVNVDSVATFTKIRVELSVRRT